MTVHSTSAETRLIGELQDRVNSLVETLRRRLTEDVFTQYFGLVDAFFRGKLILRDFVSASENLLPSDLHSLHSELRNALCDIGNTNLAHKRLLRRGIREKLVGGGEGILGASAFMPSLGDIRARVSVACALRGLSLEDDVAGLLCDAVHAHVQSILLSALPRRVQPDGFIEPVLEWPRMTMGHVQTALELQASDWRATEWEKELAEKEKFIVDSFESDE